MKERKILNLQEKYYTQESLKNGKWQKPLKNLYLRPNIKKTSKNTKRNFKNTNKNMEN